MDALTLAAFEERAAAAESRLVALEAKLVSGRFRTDRAKPSCAKNNTFFIYFQGPPPLGMEICRS